MKKYQGAVAEDWLPTFENVTREFITETLPRILFGEKLPNFTFDFREQEALDFIESVWSEHLKTYDFYKDKYEKVMKALRQPTNEDVDCPIMVINNYRQFFELLRQFYDRNIELYFLLTNNSAFPRSEKEICLEQIWLRATPDDFNNAEMFLKKQVAMITDTTFEKYDDEISLGAVTSFDNNIVCVKNGIARVWDENSREMEITIYDKNYYERKELYHRPHYTLPVIRYGIYERNGKKVCSIGSIQDKSDSFKQTDLSKKINRKKYKANEGISEEDTKQVEPKNILALSIFINLLNREGITEIEVPSLYVLDYDYHIKRNKQILKNFKKDWTEETIKKYPEEYKRCSYYFNKSYNKQELISEIKTERILLTFRRLLQHYQNSSIISYPGDADSFMHLRVPIMKSENNINGSIFKELYNLTPSLDNEREQ